MRRAGWLWLMGALAACAGGPALDVDGPARTYRLGEPDAVLDVVQTGASELSVLLVVEPSSLTFRPASDEFHAIVEWSMQVGGAEAVIVQGADTVRVASRDSVRNALPVVVDRRVAAPPGRRLIRATVSDVHSARTAQRTAVVEVRPPEGPWVAGLRVTQFERPVPTTRVPAGTDSLQLAVTVGGAPAGALLRVSATLDDDSRRATPPVRPDPAGALGGGAPPVQADTTFTVSTRVSGGGVVLAAVSVPPLRAGLYSLTLSLRDTLGQEVTSTAHPLVVRRASFPHLTRLGDLVEPLALLADSARVDEVRRGGRRALDAFWGDRIGDRRRASETLRAFYGRVERANRLFSTDEEGWTTDRGLAFVLFGPPDDVRQSPLGETWQYSPRAIAPVSVVFVRSGPVSGGSFRLQQDQRLARALELARESWRAGRVP